MAFDPGGEYLYSVSQNYDALNVFDVDPSGELSLHATFRNGVGGVTGLDRPLDVDVSPDGRLIVVGTQFSKSVVVFEKNGSSFSFVDSIQEGDTVGGSVVTNMDWVPYVNFNQQGDAFYASSPSDDSLLVFDVGTNNSLAFAGAVSDGIDGAVLSTVYDVVSSPIGNQVYVAANNSVAVLTKPSELDVNFQPSRMVELSGLSGNDQFTITPSLLTSFSVTGGSNDAAGDSLVIDAVGLPVVDSGSSVLVGSLSSLSLIHI